MEITIIFSSLLTATDITQASFPNLRRLFIEARTDHEERDVSRRAVRLCFIFLSGPTALADGGMTQFYNAVLFLGSVAVFSLIAQRMNAAQ